MDEEILAELRDVYVLSEQFSEMMHKDEDAIIDLVRILFHTFPSQTTTLTITGACMQVILNMSKQLALDTFEDSDDAPADEVKKRMVSIVGAFAKNMVDMATVADARAMRKEDA